MDEHPRLTIDDLTVLEVPKLDLPEFELTDDGEDGYQDVDCQGCVFNSPLYEINMDAHTCVMRHLRQVRCLEYRVIYILPEQYPRWAARYAANKLEK